MIHCFQNKPLRKSANLLFRTGDTLFKDDFHSIEFISIKNLLLSSCSFTINTCPKAPLPSPRTTLKSVINFGFKFLL